MIIQEYAKTFKKVVDLPIINDITIKKILCINGINYWWPLSWGFFHELCQSSSLHVIRNIGLIYRIMDRIVPIDLFISHIQRQLYGISGSNKRIDGNNIKIIVLDVESSWKSIPTSIPGKPTYYNTYHGDIIDAIKKQKDVAIYSYCFRMNIFKQTPSKIKELKRKSADIRIMSDYYTLSMWNEKRRSGTYFKKIYKLICDNPNWIHQWGIVSEKSDETVKSIFRYYLLIVLPELVGFASMFNTIIRKEKPDLFFQSWEHADYRRVATVVAGKNNVPTVALQHGYNSPTSLDYTYHDETSAIITDMQDEFPIPMATCVWSEWDQELLHNNGHYPKESVIVTGNPRYDYLGHAHERYSRKEVCKRFGINIGYNIVLWVTQCHANSFDENKQYFREVFSTIKSLDNTVLIVKQHPGEGEMYTKLIQQYILEYQLSDKVILPNKNSDTTELVYISDVIINKHSTTGQEAVAFYKPMIILDFTDYPYAGMYVEEGVAVPCFEEGTLKSTLMNIFEHGFHKEENQKIFIRKHMYKLDGCAAKRVADVILSKLGKNRPVMTD